MTYETLKIGPLTMPEAREEDLRKLAERSLKGMIVECAGALVPVFRELDETRRVHAIALGQLGEHIAALEQQVAALTKERDGAQNIAWEQSAERGKAESALARAMPVVEAAEAWTDARIPGHLTRIARAVYEMRRAAQPKGETP